MRGYPAFFCSLGLVLHALPAAADSAYPSAIASNLQIASTPACTLCHNGTPGTGTATTSFAVAMKERGLSPVGDTSTVSIALAKMKTDQVDSDGDGTIDIDELVNGDDPNAGAGGGGSAPGLTYGCGAQLAPGGAPEPWIAAAATAIGLVIARRRRR